MSGRAAAAGPDAGAAAGPPRRLLPDPPHTVWRPEAC